MPSVSNKKSLHKNINFISHYLLDPFRQIGESELALHQTVFQLRRDVSAILPPSCSLQQTLLQSFPTETWTFLSPFN